jgi:hypothetical protein
VGDGPERLLVSFAAKGDARAVVSVAHERLPDAAAAAAAKDAWKGRLASLRTMLEG